MSIDISGILVRGGAPRLAFLRYCVLSISMEPVFLCVAQEYRLRPAHAAALALFDVFCARQAPARLAAYELLPPRQLRVEAEIARIRAQSTQLQSPELPDEDSVLPLTAPARHLFDAIVAGLQQDTRGRLARLASAYDPHLAPEQNLPGGKLSAVQRHFVENVWRPALQPVLVGAGFWQVATLA